MLIGRFRIYMAIDTGNLHVIGGICVTIRAGTPFAIVGSTVNREMLAIVIKSRRHPGILSVASGTIRGKLQSPVIWLRGLFIICLMATVAGIGCVVEIAADMAIGAIGHIGMRAIEGPDSVVIEG